MKKVLYSLLAVAALAFAVSCSKDQTTAIADGDEVTVTFDVDALAGLQTKAISDGLRATDLTVAVYTADKSEISALKKTTTFSNRKAQVSFNLVKGQTYNFAFWAVNPNCSAYSFNTAAAKVTVSYEGVSANDESRDAFFAVEEGLTVTGPMSRNITLKRPFAQLNFGSAKTDWDAAVDAGITVKQSKLALSTKLHDTISLFDGAVSGEKDVTFALADIPTEKLTVDGVDYVYLEMNYMLAPAEKTLIDATFSVNDADGEINTINFSNVPIQRNWRTNIVGNLLTSTVDFNVIIDPEYTGEYNDEYKEVVVGTAAQLLDAAATMTNGKIILSSDIKDLASQITFSQPGSKILDLNGKTISNDTDIWNTRTDAWSLVSVQAGELTITGNGTLKAKEDDEFAVDVRNGASVTIEDGTFIGNISAVYVYEGTGNIKGGTYSIQQVDAAKQYDFTLNLYDANRTAGTAAIIVTGGSFYKFNPGDNAAEGANTNFLADGYTAAESGDYYVVSAE